MNGSEFLLWDVHLEGKSERHKDYRGLTETERHVKAWKCIVTNGEHSRTDLNEVFQKSRDRKVFVSLSGRACLLFSRALFALMDGEGVL